MTCVVAVTVATSAAAAVLVARNFVHVRVGAAAPRTCAAVGAFVVVAFTVAVATVAAVAAVTNVDCLQLAQRCI